MSLLELENWDLTKIFHTIEKIILGGEKSGTALGVPAVPGMPPLV